LECFEKTLISFKTLSKSTISTVGARLGLVIAVWTSFNNGSFEGKGDVW